MTDNQGQSLIYYLNLVWQILR